MSSIDDFLNELKAQHQQKQSGDCQPPPANLFPQQRQEDGFMDDLLADLKSEFKADGNSQKSESDLEQIRQRYEQPKDPPKVESQNSDLDLEAIRQRHQKQKDVPVAKSQDSDLDLDSIRQHYESQKLRGSAQSSDAEPDLEQVRLRAMQMRSQREAAKASAAQTEDLLDNMRDRYIQNRAIERQKREATEREEKLRRQQREALKPRAREWLARLDPYSDEGFWFDSFAQGYGDRLEAALDYLQALEK